VSRLFLTGHQRRRLSRQLAGATDVRVYRRTLALLELDRGRPAEAVARMLGVSRQTVQNWVARFRQAGRAADLADAGRSGRPALLDDEALDFLWAVLTRTPHDMGLPHTGWTVPLLCRLLAIATGREPSGDTVRRVLADWDFAWKRPRYVLAPDPEREKKTADPPADPRPARAERRPGRGRDRPAPVPAPAGRLGEARGAG
jgi:transposase